MFETMSKISFNAIVPLVVASYPADVVQSLLREIIVLQAKLDTIDEQDICFQKDQKSHEKKLDEMKVEYSQIVELVNNNDVDYFLEQIKEAEEIFRKVCSPGSSQPVFVKLMVDANTKSQIGYFKDLIQIKGQYKKLMTLDELMHDEQVLLDIFS